MIEFKQIIGRGTRIREDYGKQFFTILDFRNVTAHFADPTFDGDPVVIKPQMEKSLQMMKVNNQIQAIIQMIFLIRVVMVEV